MDILKLALDSRVPFVAIKSDDLLYVEEVLSYIAGTVAVPFILENLPEDWSTVELPSADVLYTSAELACRELYFLMASKKKTLVFVNPTKLSALMFNGGQMLPPKDMVLEQLTVAMKNEEDALGVLNAFGGLTLKDIRELLQMTAKKFGKITPKGINTIRQSYISKLKGMVQVDTTLEFYDCPGSLGAWLKDNLFFFQNDVAFDLRPRGLLFDGTPGTGKTAAAKAIANTLGMPLFRLDMGSMKGKYVGDSEANLNAALQTIDQMAPCVVILDEIEKMFGEQQDHGVTSSMLGTLLWWLQEHQSKVLTLMTTNNMKILPQELYREGRIDKTLTFNGLATATEAQKFGATVLDLVSAKVPLENPQEVLSTLVAQLQTAKFPIPQAKVTTMVYGLVKQQYLSEKDKMEKAA